MIRQSLAPGDAGRVDELPLAQRQELAAHQPGQARPQDQAEHDRQQQRHVVADRVP